MTFVQLCPGRYRTISIAIIKIERIKRYVIYSHKYYIDTSAHKDVLFWKLNFWFNGLWGEPMDELRRWPANRIHGSRERKSLHMPSALSTRVQRPSLSKAFNADRRFRQGLSYILERYAPVITGAYSCWIYSTACPSFHMFPTNNKTRFINPPLYFRKCMANCCYCSELNDEDLAFESKSNYI